MNRPYVICHMCTTIDGKILGDRWTKLPGGKTAGNLFEPTAATFNIGAWLVGTTTMKEFSARSAKLPSPKTPVPQGDFIAKPKAKSFAIGADAKALLRFQKSDVDGDHVVVLITDNAPAPYRAHLRQAGVSYLLCGRKEIDLHLALKKLHTALGLKKLMLQGGGAFNGSMLQAGLVDEISQIIVPIVDAGGPTITGVFDYPDTPPKQSAAALQMISHKTLKGGAHWFRYRLR